MAYCYSPHVLRVLVDCDGHWEQSEMRARGSAPEAPWKVKQGQIKMAHIFCEGEETKEFIQPWPQGLECKYNLSASHLQGLEIHLLPGAEHGVVLQRDR